MLSKILKAMKKKVPLPTLIIQDTTGNVTYTPKGPLSNRGQPGVAGFYQEEVLPNAQEELPAAKPLQLIKQDKPGTCFAESLVVDYLPPGEENRKAIIRAHVGISHVQGHPKQTMLVSIQDKHIPKEGEVFKKFDELILGHERDPGTSESEESQNSESIKQYFATQMSEAAKLQLAQAIYLSQLNGDESLHTGQFVCSAKEEADNQGNKKYRITEIKRIDFGALGRYAMLRTENDNRPDHTSAQYQHKRLINQSGKDYVSFLLQDPDIKYEVNRLWSKTDPQEVVRQQGQRFDEQVAGLGQFKEKPLHQFNKELGATTGTSDEASVRENLLQSTERRCEQMKAAAIQYQNRIVQDMVVIESFYQYVRQQIDSNPADLAMQTMKVRLEEINNLPLEERFQKMQEAQTELLEAPLPSKPAPEVSEAERRMTRYKEQHKEASAPTSESSQKDPKAEVSLESPDEPGPPPSPDTFSP